MLEFCSQNLFLSARLFIYWCTVFVNTMGGISLQHMISNGIHISLKYDGLIESKGSVISNESSLIY